VSDGLVEVESDFVESALVSVELLGVAAADEG
jgi:hypothetical protein